MNRQPSKSTSNGESTERVNGLPSGDRVVMRHGIALNLDEFRAAPEGFDPRHEGDELALMQAERPFMSIVVPNYNGRQWLPSVMKALARQTFQDFEVVLVDDASDDDSVDWMANNYPEARVIANRRNLGFAQSCNLGATAARGRMLILLNSDTEPEPEWLEELAKGVCRNPDAGMFASKVLLMDRPEQLHTTGDMLGADGIPVNRGVWELDLGQYDARTEVFGGCGCALAIRSELWYSLGGFDEDYWMYLEDVDLAFRAQLAGFRSVFVPAARIYHHLTGTAGGTLASYYVGRNTVWLIAKNMPTSLLVRNWRQIIAGQFRIALDALDSIRGREARSRLRGQAVGLLTMWRMLAKRRIVQSRRQVDAADLRKTLYG